MGTDYKKISEDHEKRYGWDAKPRRIYKQLYNDKTHFVYELIQNADDSKSQHLELQLDSTALYVWNDGCQFKEKDVRNICSLGSSDKDLTQIGTFGIGFKAVYNYTDLPEIYSNEERFRIRDFIKPEGIDSMSPEIAKLVNEGKTVFRLPFKDSPHQEDDIKHLKDRLCNLANERSLLFLRNLERIEWKDKRKSQTGSYSCHRHSFEKIQTVPENGVVELVKLTTSLNCNNRRAETFLVFSKEVKPQRNVVKELLGRAKDEEDEEDRKRILKSSEELQPIQVAFKLQDDRIIPIDNDCVLFAFLPTQKETHLKFLIQARYQTTPARDNIPKPHENPWNRWLVQETANFLPDVLEQLKTGGMLEPTFFNVLPLKGEVENDFKPIAEALQKAMQERAFVPTEKEGHYAKAKKVFYPDSPHLRELVKSSGMYADSSLLHPYIERDTKEFTKCFDIMQEAGVKRIDVKDMLDWLEEQSIDWFKDRTNEWLCSLYTYLKKEQKGQSGRIKKLPLIRLENGEQVCAKDGLAFFPPDTDEEREEIAPFLKELPILLSVLLEGDDSYEIKAFIKSLGVRALHPEEIINESICPKYLQSENPSVAQNLIHVRYLFKIWDKISDTEIQKKIRETPILRAYKGPQQENFKFVVPCDAYLPRTYTGNTDLEDYFSASDGKIWFIDEAYLDDDSDQKIWLKFLKAIGTIDTPKVIEESFTVDYQNLQELANKYDIDWEYRGNEETIKDLHFDGLLEVLDQITNRKNVDIPQVLWRLLVKALPSREYAREPFFNGTYRWFYYRNRQKPFDATFYRQLKETAWLPDEQGNLYRPSECFAPTSENRKVLGDSVAYLHTDFDISKDNETHQWLADKLGVHLNANTDSVMNYLQTLSGSTVNVEDIMLLYRFLEDRSARREEKFKAEPLIFTTDPEPRWWKSGEVFWDDESAVFANHRGYLKKNYADYEKTLKHFFIAIGISERASPLDYVRVIQEVTSEEQAEDANVRERINILYSRLWPSLPKNGSSLEDEEWQEKWKEIREGKCWLGKKGSKWDFFYKDELVWNDNNYLAEIFEDSVPFWEFEDALLELAKHLGIEGCSQVKVVAKPSGFQEKDHDSSEKVRNLYPFIDAFLKSPGLGNKKDTKSVEVITRLTVCRVEELEVKYDLKGILRVDPKPPLSFLDENVQEAKLWLTSAAAKNEYAELIGDALQEHFNVRDLGRFAEDLLTKDPDKVLSRWERKGLKTGICVLPQEEIAENKQFPELINEELPEETDSEPNVPETIEPKVETPIPDERPETNSRDESETHTHPKSTNWTSQSGVHRKNPTHSGSEVRWRGRGGGGGGEGKKHLILKDYLANNPSLLGQGLKLVGTEYKFKSGDASDILLEDSSGNPITVEVKPPISHGSDQEAWQAVKYKHLAAVEYGLSCEQVRSILAAPEIPDDVKEKCRELGIDPIEVSMPKR